MQYGMHIFNNSSVNSSQIGDVDMMLAKLKFSFVVALLFLISIHSFFLPSSRSIRQNVRMMADVEVVFPNNKKAKVAVGSALKDAAKKAGRILNV
jgi:hypothetical protein